MKNLKKILTFGILMGGLMAHTTFAGTGLIISDATSEQPCTQTDPNGGLIISDLAGLIISDLAGLIISDFASEPVECPAAGGLIISD